MCASVLWVRGGEGVSCMMRACKCLCVGESIDE